MTLFLDTASIDDIKTWFQTGVFKGITTNQKIFLKEKGVNFKTRLLEILQFVDVPVSVELTKTGEEDYNLLKEGTELAQLGKNIVIKVPMWGDGRGLRIANKLMEVGVSVNMTCCMSVNQAILACELGARYVSLFYNRITDYHKKRDKIVGEYVISDTRHIIELQGYKTQIIAGSIRKPDDVSKCFCAGAHIVTVTPTVLAKLPYHPKTEETIQEFDRAWEEFRRATD